MEQKIQSQKRKIFKYSFLSTYDEEQLYILPPEFPVLDTNDFQTISVNWKWMPFMFHSVPLLPWINWEINRKLRITDLECYPKENTESLSNLGKSRKHSLQLLLLSLPEENSVGKYNLLSALPSAPGQTTLGNNINSSPHWCSQETAFSSLSSFHNKKLSSQMRLWRTSWVNLRAKVINFDKLVALACSKSGGRERGWGARLEGTVLSPH